MKINPYRCDQYVYDHGTMVASVAGSPSDVHRWVREIAESSGQRVDWHVVGDAIVVLAVGDLESVWQAVRELPFPSSINSSSAASKKRPTSFAEIVLK